jgi:hypothetical protein
MLSTVAWPRLAAYRSGGGKAWKQQLHSDSLFPGRCHARWTSHAWRKGKHGPQLALGVLEQTITRLFRGSLPGNLPAGAEAFPVAMRALAALLPTSRGVGTRAFRTAKSRLQLGKRGNVFTHRPSRWNPYVLQFSRCWSNILTEEGKSGDARDARAQAPLCQGGNLEPLKKWYFRNKKACDFWIIFRSSPF